MIVGDEPPNSAWPAGLPFEVTVTGPGPLSYQWYYNASTAITGATNAALPLTNLQNGSYSCTVSNPYGINQEHGLHGGRRHAL